MLYGHCYESDHCGCCCDLLIVEYIRDLLSDVKCEPWSRERTCIRSLLLSDSCHWSRSATTVPCVGCQPSGLC
jgi:hypothetical protein